MVTAAQHLVTHLARLLVDVTDDDLGTLDDHLAAYGAGVVRGAGAAPAERLDLEHLDPVGELDQALRAGEELGAEVRGDAEGEDVEAEVVDDAGELVDLSRGEDCASSAIT